MERAPARFAPRAEALNCQHLNPTIRQGIIDEAMENDPARAQAEYGALFRSDIESYINREAVEACVAPGLLERAPQSGLRYVCFVDPSGGSADSFSLAISHRDADQVFLDAVREARPPFSPESVVGEFAQLCKSYRVSKVTGDRYAGEWPREQFRKLGIAYELAPKPKSDLYRDLLPVINSRKVELLDHTKLIAQLCGLERRTARSGRDSIDHSPGAHDDIANAAAGALVVAQKPVQRIRGFAFSYDIGVPANEFDIKTGRPIEPERTRVRWVKVREADARAARGP
jgi:hypothetical protein